MLKRNIAILIAGGLLGVQAGLATADQGYFPSNDTEVIWKALPTQARYLEQRAASIQKEGVVLRGDSFLPSNDTVVIWKALPSQAKYFAQREASILAEAQGNMYNTIKVSASTKNVTVEHLGTVKIVNARGQSFVWTCDAPGEHVVSLKAVAPAGFAAGDTMIYVRHPAAHIPG